MADSMARLPLRCLTRSQGHHLGLWLGGTCAVGRECERLDPAQALCVEQETRDIGPRIMTGRIGRILGDADRTEVDLRDQKALLLGWQLLDERAAVRSVDRGMPAADMQQ